MLFTPAAKQGNQTWVTLQLTGALCNCECAINDVTVVCATDRTANLILVILWTFIKRSPILVHMFKYDIDHEP